MRATEILETERPTGRPPKDGDVDLLHGLHRDPRAMATLGGLRDAASQRVMQKAGFRYDRDFTYADRPHVLYRLSKESLERPQ